MAVYTKLSNNDINSILHNYKIGSLDNAAEISAGVENTNYLLTTTTGKYILTIFEKRVNRKDLPFFIDLMNFLAQNSFPSPKILANHKSYIFNFKAKTGVIISFLTGDIAENVTLNDDILFNLGNKLGQMHNLTAKFPLKRANDFALNGIEKLFQTVKLKRLLQDEEQNLSINIINNFKSHNLTNLSKAIIHADLFPDNIFVNADKICGVIDFYFSCHDYINYDIATTINAWCFDDKLNFNLTFLNKLLKGYNFIKPLSAADKKYLYDFCLLTALRFYLTRIYDKFHQPRNSNNIAKNPDEFLQRIKFWLNFTEMPRILEEI